MQSGRELFGIPKKQNPVRSQVSLTTGVNLGSVGLQTRCFDLLESISGSAFKYTKDAAAGDLITILEDGVYTMNYTDNLNSAGSIGISLNATIAQQALSIETLPLSAIICLTSLTQANQVTNTSATLFLKTGDILRAQTSAPIGANSIYTRLRVTKVSL